MKALVIGTSVVLLALVSQASADLLLYDGFQYTAGQPLADWVTYDNNVTIDPAGSPNDQYNAQYGQYWRYAGNHNEFYANTNAAPRIASGSLPGVAGMPAPVGNSLGFDNTQIAAGQIAIPGGPITTGTVYWSGFLRVNAVNDLKKLTDPNAAAGMLVAAFGNGTGVSETTPGTIGATLKITKHPTEPNQYLIGTGRNNATAATVAWANSVPLTAGDTVFVVGSYTFVAGGNNDIARMWINPDSSTFGQALEPTETITGPSSATINEIGSIKGFNLRNVNTMFTTGGLPPEVQFDELRIGNTWADVTTPEPASMLLIAAGLAGLAARRKR